MFFRCFFPLLVLVVIFKRRQKSAREKRKSHYNFIVFVQLQPNDEHRTYKESIRRKQREGDAVPFLFFLANKCQPYYISISGQEIVYLFCRFIGKNGTKKNAIHLFKCIKMACVCVWLCGRVYTTIKLYFYCTQTTRGTIFLHSLPNRSRRPPP